MALDLEQRDVLLLDMRDRIIRIETKIEVGDFEQRIRGLERWRWGIPGSVLGSILAGVIALTLG